MSKPFRTFFISILLLVCFFKFSFANTVTKARIDLCDGFKNDLVQVFVEKNLIYKGIATTIESSGLAMGGLKISTEKSTISLMLSIPAKSFSERKEVDLKKGTNIKISIFHDKGENKYTLVVNQSFHDPVYL